MIRFTYTREHKRRREVNVRRPISIDSDALDTEDFCFDPERASAEGLYQEMLDDEGNPAGQALPITNELFDAIPSSVSTSDQVRCRRSR